MVCPAISSCSFGATVLIFCRMFIHIWRFACPQDFDGQAGASFVSYRHASFISLKTNCKFKPEN
jgi:hypothetical protein